VRISRDDLVTIIGKISNHLMSLNGEPEINTDYYWTILPPEWKDFSTKQPEISVGSVQSDWSELRRICDPDEVVSFVDYDRLASVLRHVSEEYIGDRIGKCQV